jgi:hypothetical protein
VIAVVTTRRRDAGARHTWPLAIVALVCVALWAYGVAGAVAATGQSVAPPAIGSYESPDPGWGLSADAPPSDVERGRRIESVSVKRAAQVRTRTHGGGSGLCPSSSDPTRASVRLRVASPSPGVLHDGRDTHLRLGVLLI